MTTDEPRHDDSIPDTERARTQRVQPDRIEPRNSGRQRLGLRHLLPDSIIVAGIVFLAGIFVYAILQSQLCGPQTANRCFLVFAVCGMILLGLSLRLSYNFRVNLAICVASVGVGIYVSEVALYYLYVYREDRSRIAASQGINYDTRSVLEVVLKMRKAGKDAYPAVSPCEFIDSDGIGRGATKLFPLAGVSDKPTVLCNETGRFAIYRSDAHGFNNPQGSWLAPNAEIVLLGDSLVHGQCVDPTETISARLRARMGKKVLNLAFHGTGPLVQLATLIEYAEKVRPKAVFWHYYEGNDHSDLVAEEKSPTLMRYLNEKEYSQNLIGRQGQVDKLLEAYIDERMEAGNLQPEERSIPFADLVKLTFVRIALGAVSHTYQCDYPLLKRILSKARRRVSHWGGRLYLVYLPEYSRYAAKESYDDEGRRKLLEIADKLDIECLDFTEVLSAYPDPVSLFPFRVAGHYLPKGYDMVAEMIARRLAKNP